MSRECALKIIELLARIKINSTRVRQKKMLFVCPVFSITQASKS